MNGNLSLRLKDIEFNLVECNWIKLFQATFKTRAVFWPTLVLGYETGQVMTGTLCPWDLTTCFQILGIFRNRDFWLTGRLSPFKLPKYLHITSANTSVCKIRKCKKRSLCIIVENFNFLCTKDWNILKFNRSYLKNLFTCNSRLVLVFRWKFPFLVTKSTKSHFS